MSNIPKGRHTLWAATFIGTESELLTLAQDQTFDYGQRVVVISTLSPIEYGSHLSNGGQFCHVHVLFRIRDRQGRSANCTYAPLRELLVKNLPSLQMPYLQPCQDKLAWESYCTKTLRNVDVIQQFIMNQLSAGQSDDAIVSSLIDKYGLDVAVKYSGNRLEALRAHHKILHVNTLPFSVTANVVRDCIWEFIRNSIITVPMFPSLTTYQKRFLLFHYYLLFKYIRRVSNTADGYGGVYLFGSPNTGNLHF